MSAVTTRRKKSRTVENAARAARIQAFKQRARELEYTILESVRTGAPVSAALLPYLAVAFEAEDGAQWPCEERRSCSQMEEWVKLRRIGLRAEALWIERERRWVMDDADEDGHRHVDLPRNIDEEIAEWVSSDVPNLARERLAELRARGIPDCVAVLQVFLELLQISDDWDAWGSAALFAVVDSIATRESRC